MIHVPKHIKRLVPYKAGKPIEDLIREKGLKKIVKLASNENPLGPSPKAIEKIKNSLSNLHRYTNPSAFELVNAIAKSINKSPDMIVTASGSDALLQYIISTFSVEGDELLTSEGTFIGWYVNANKYNRKLLKVPLLDFRYDLKSILNNVTVKTKIIYLANPNNPTGSIFTKNEFELFMEKLPENILVVLDEAYTLYAEDNPQYPNGLDYDYKNLIVTRTLSKAYGLAGIRIGFAVGHSELISQIYKTKLPFEPNMLAQEAAIAALTDYEFIKRTVKQNKKSLHRFKEKFDSLNIKYVPTSANFYLLIFQSEEFAKNFYEACLNYGLILRHVNTFGLPNCVRINSGNDQETEFALSVIEKVYTSLSKQNK